MASEPSSQSSRAPMTPSELVAFVKNQLEAEDERQAPVSATTLSEQLPNGSTLDLSHKKISSLPLEVLLLIKDKVERLALSHNPNITLPHEIALCDRLRYLNLRWNKLRHFPEAVLSLSKLEILDISKNAIEKIPEEISKMSNLKFLAVARNQIKRLPMSLGEMNLVKLKFDENPIEYPPLSALQAATDHAASMIESERDKDICQAVKRFMRAERTRSLLRADSQEDLSEKDAETPRPPKRGVTGGRFPVRPSISGIESNPRSMSESPPDPPPIPTRSHARGISTNTVQPPRRPIPAPLQTSNDGSRSRSETVATSVNIRNRRQGYVPRKNTGLNLLSEMSSQLSARSVGQTHNLTPPHTRAPSVTSTHSHYFANGSGEESSGATSPTEEPPIRSIMSRKLASLPESRNSRLSTINSTSSVKRVLSMLQYLHKPTLDLIQKLVGGTPHKANLERCLANAAMQVDQLDRLITGANSIIEENVELNPSLLSSIICTASVALDRYTFALKEIRRSVPRIMKNADAFHARFVITTAYGGIIECRNICRFLGFDTKMPSSRNSLRAAQARTHQTITPTQSKLLPGGRRRGTILPSSGSISNSRGIAPPVPLNGGSRSNTMSSATSRFNDAYTHLPQSSNVPSRINTVRSVLADSEPEDGVEGVYPKLRNCCDLASQILPPVLGELKERKTRADQMGLIIASRHFAQAINRCDFVIKNNNRLLARLKTMKVGEPARSQFSQMTESFGRDWTNFVTEIVRLANQGIDVGNIRRTLKPLQHAVKDANKTATQPIQYSRPPPPTSIHVGFPTTLNTAVPPVAGPVTPVPATPLGAALGAAVQATVPPTPTTAFNSPEYFPPNQSRRPTAQSTETALPQPSYSRR